MLSKKWSVLQPRRSPRDPRRRSYPKPLSRRLHSQAMMTAMMRSWKYHHLSIDSWKLTRMQRSIFDPPVALNLWRYTGTAWTIQNRLGRWLCAHEAHAFWWKEACRDIFRWARRGTLAGIILLDSATDAPSQIFLQSVQSVSRPARYCNLLPWWYCSCSHPAKVCT